MFTIKSEVAVAAHPVAPFPAAAAPGAVTGGVRLTLRAEGLAALVLAAVLYAGTGRGWGLFALLFFAPDLTFAAFLAGPRVGAAAYNALHTYVGPLALVLLAHALARPALLPVAYVWAAHVGFDRLAGYGLKYASGFGDTHLGRTGPAARGLRA
jgi:hypothetical protein